MYFVLIGNLAKSFVLYCVIIYVPPAGHRISHIQDGQSRPPGRMYLQKDWPSLSQEYRPQEK